MVATAAEVVVAGSWTQHYWRYYLESEAEVQTSSDVGLERPMDSNLGYQGAEWRDNCD